MVPAFENFPMYRVTPRCLPVTAQYSLKVIWMQLGMEQNSKYGIVTCSLVTATVGRTGPSLKALIELSNTTVARCSVKKEGHIW